MPSLRRCKWWNMGYCREGTRCSYNHPLLDCQQHLQGCSMRHRRRCKFWGTPAGCFRTEKFQYFHQIIAEKVTQNEKFDVVKEYTKLYNHKEIEVKERLIKKMNSCDILVRDKDFIEDSEEDAIKTRRGRPC